MVKTTLIMPASFFILRKKNVPLHYPWCSAKNQTISCKVIWVIILIGKLGRKIRNAWRLTCKMNAICADKYKLHGEYIFEKARWIMYN